MEPSLDDYIMFLEQNMKDAEPNSKEQHEFEEDLCSLRYYQREIRLITMKYDPNR